MEDRSMYCAIVDKKKIWLPQTAIEEQFRRKKQVLQGDAMILDSN
jgi:hypothetical protein